jgi:hypothetical protein
MANNLCECCDKNPSVAVASVAGMPMSIAWCRDCLEAGVSPYWALVANAISIDGMDHAADWFIAEVEHSLKYFKKTWAQFNEEVARGIKEMDEDLERMALMDKSE